MRAKLLVVAAAAAVAVAGTLPGAARAQDGPVTAYVDAVDAWATGARLQQLLPDGRRTGTTVRRAARRKTHVPTATPTQLRRLRITRRTAVTARNNRDVAARMPAVDPATVVADIERNRGLAHRAMRALRGRWSANDLGDVAAFALLSAYASYHDRDTVPGRSALALRRTLRHALARTRGLRKLSPAAKQTAAEMIEVRMVYAIAALQRARAAGDAADASIAESEIRIWIRDVFGLDVEALRLTSRGFASA